MSGDPFRLLEAEHLHALAALARLECAALGLRADPGSANHRCTVREVLGVLTTEVRQHNEKEERELFPLLADEAPTAVFEEEHRRLRMLEREMAQLLDAPDQRDPGLAEVALEVVDLLREHISRENEVLFPMARVQLGPEGVKLLGRRLR